MRWSENINKCPNYGNGNVVVLVWYATRLFATFAVRSFVREARVRWIGWKRKLLLEREGKAKHNENKSMRLLQIGIQNNMVKAWRLKINVSEKFCIFNPFGLSSPTFHYLSRIVLAPFTIIIFISMEIITMSRTTPATEEEENFTTRWIVI